MSHRFWLTLSQWLTAQMLQNATHFLYHLNMLGAWESRWDVGDRVYDEDDKEYDDDNKNDFQSELP